MQLATVSGSSAATAEMEAGSWPSGEKHDQTGRVGWSEILEAEGIGLVVLVLGRD